MTARPAADVASDVDAYSIAEFCRRHSISIPLFYKLKQQGKGPATFYAGVRQLISRESAAAWRREREAAAIGENPV
ncbi:hypothetical protein Q2941_33495 [Bradyrhizobium sp. UFLA05-153]